jgi:hypothetical protein
VEHYDLDPESLDKVMKAQIHSCLTKADTMAKLALLCVNFLWFCLCC